MDDNKESDDEGYNKDVLDLSRSCLKKIPKVEDAQSVKTLILDENELQKIENIDAYLKIEKLSLSKNQLLRMYGISRLTCLRELNISYNGILTIEGLKELQNLRHLNLEGNNIKTIEHLNTNTVLETLNLSENSILQIGDISVLKCLKELYLHGNRISHLRQCDKYLPTSLEVLSLKRNNLTDLNELCTLSHLSNLNHVAIADNPCVQMTGNAIGFDYRPFVLNWIMSVKIIDGYVVNPIESLKAEWLYSQGRGRQFRIGEQSALASYLATVCPFSGEALENENERKLRLILSKAQQHQRQLQEQISNSDNSSTNNSPSLLRKKGPTTRIQSPRFSRLSGGRHNSPDKMSSSYHGNVSNSSMTSSITESTAPSHSNQLLEMTNSLIENFTSDIMTQSLDPTILSGNSTSVAAVTQPNRDMTNSYSKQQQLSRNNLTNFYNDQSSHQMYSGPLTAASKMVPVPESLMSPDCCPAAVVQRVGVAVCGTTANLTATTPQIPQPVKTKADNRLQTQPVNGSGNRKSPKAVKRIEKPSVINSRKFSNNTSPRAQLTKAQSHFSDASTVGTSTSDDDSDSVNVDKLKTIRNKAAQQKNQKQKDNNNVLEQQQIAQPPVVNKTTENSAILIQKIWRGFVARKQNAHIAEVLQRKRTQDYIIKLTQDMEMTKAALENERKIQQLQMQAINALWKKVTAMQTTNEGGGDATVAAAREVPSEAAGFNLTSNQSDSVAVVQDLTKTCSLLMNQVQQLQVSMRDIITFMSAVANIPPPPPSESQNNETHSKDSCETQTEIIAVHTPQVEDLPTFPFTKASGKLMATGRPSSLPIMHSKERGDDPIPANITEEIDDGQEEPEEDEIEQQFGPSDTNDVVV